MDRYQRFPLFQKELRKIRRKLTDEFLERQAKVKLSDIPKEEIYFKVNKLRLLVKTKEIENQKKMHTLELKMKNQEIEIEVLKNAFQKSTTK